MAARYTPTLATSYQKDSVSDISAKSLNINAIAIESEPYPEQEAGDLNSFMKKSQQQIALKHTVIAKITEITLSGRLAN